MKKKPADQASFGIEDYAFLSDTQSGALVSRDGCVDWLCLPRFDSGACFAALLGGRKTAPGVSRRREKSRSASAVIAATR